MPQTSRLYGVNITNTIAGLTALGAETLFDTANATVYSVDGQLFSAAAVVDGATPVLDGDGNPFPALAVTNSDGSISGKGAAVVWCRNAATATVCFQGPITTLDGLSTNFEFAPQFPGIPDDVTPYAYQILKQQTDGVTADSSTFGASNWDATRFTNTITNCATLPRRPQEI
jgi:hypothetical protein